MARRSRNSGAIDDLFAVLEAVFQVFRPWTSIPVAIVGFFFISKVWAAVIRFPPLQNLGLIFGGGFAVLCLLAGWKGAQFRARQRAFLGAKIDMDWVRGLSWRGFERQMAEVYRQKGYEVEETGGGGADGGIDLKLFKEGRTTIVQCKHWKTWKVGVREIRELFGVMTSEQADAAIFITSGRYTSDAQQFAEGKPIELIGQDEFLELVRQFQRDLKKQSAPAEPAEAFPEELSTMPPPRCPKCRQPMVLRRAKTGPTAGKEFWGCSTYPRCRGTLDAVMPKQFGD